MENNQTEQVVEVIEVKPKKKRKKLALILSGLILASSITGGVVYYQHIQEVEAQRVAEYETTMMLVVESMIGGSAMAEDLINEYRKVWLKSIESRYGFRLHGEYVNDFNDALKVQYKYFEQKGVVKNIESLNVQIDKVMKELANPKQEHKELYDLIVSMYGDYEQFMSLAKSPSGSLKSYADETNRLSGEIVRKYREFNVRKTF